jgi:hypothetical protein
MADRNDGLYRQALENDAREAMRNLYQEQLLSKVEQDKINRAEMSNRMDRFEQGNPVNADRSAVQKGMDAYIQVAEAGGTERDATEAARSALNEGRRTALERLDDPSQRDKDQSQQVQIGLVIDPNDRGR